MTDWNDSAQLQALDASGYVVLHALAPARYSPSAWSLSKPYPFECDDGHTYWCKGNGAGAPVQHGLAAELIAGRLAHRLGVGGPCAIVRVEKSVAPPDGSAPHLLGVVVGSRHHAGMANARTWIPILQMNRLPGDAIDPLNRAKVVAFQTWIGAEDAQVLVDFSKRKLVSIDHGGCFPRVARRADQVDIIVTKIAGIDPNVGRQVELVQQAVCEIESITDEDLLDVVSRIPRGARWGATTDRRLAIGGWLADRRDRLRPALLAWATGERDESDIGLPTSRRPEGAEALIEHSSLGLPGSPAPC